MSIPRRAQRRHGLIELYAGICAPSDRVETPAGRTLRTALDVVYGFSGKSPVVSDAGRGVKREGEMNRIRINLSHSASNNSLHEGDHRSLMLIGWACSLPHVTSSWLNLDDCCILAVGTPINKPSNISLLCELFE